MIRCSAITKHHTRHASVLLRDRVVGEIPVDGGAGYTEHLRDVGGGDARVPKPARLDCMSVVDFGAIAKRCASARRRS
jgi:hypothetical protein